MMSKILYETPFLGTGKAPSTMQREILDFIFINGGQRKVQDSSGRLLGEFYSNTIVDEFVRRGFKIGSISSALNLLKEKGWITNKPVFGQDWKRWYYLL